MSGASMTESTTLGFNYNKAFYEPQPAKFSNQTQHFKKNATHAT